MKKYRLNEALVSYDAFLTKTNESDMSSSMSASTSPSGSNVKNTSTVSDFKVDSEYVTNLSAEIDNIINGLKDISVQLEPESVEESESQLNESLADTFFGGDPLFPLLAGGLAGILGIFGLGVKAIKDSKRNSKLGASVEADYNKLKTLKVQEVRLEAAIDKLKQRQETFKADSGLKSDEEDIENRTSTSDEPDPAAAKAKAKMRMVSQKINTQIQTIQKKKDDVSKAVEEFQAHLDEKYSADNLSGFFSGKVRKLIAFKKNEIANTVAELKLKLLSDDMDPEEKAKLEETIKKTQEDMKAGLESVKKEDQENEAKVDANKDKIIAEYDKKIKELEDSKEGQDERQSLATDMKIVGFKMQKAKLEKDTEKVDLFKGKLNDLRKKISELGDEEPAKEEPTSEEPKAEEPAKEEPKAEEPKAEEPAKNSKDDKLARVDALIKKEEEKVSKNPEAEKIKSKISELETAIDDLKNKEKKDKKDQDKIDVMIAALNSKKKELDKATGSEKLNKLKDLKDKIAAKESWQLEGTELGRIFEMEIKKLESMITLNESLSVKDAFSRLI